MSEHSGIWVRLLVTSSKVMTINTLETFEWVSTAEKIYLSPSQCPSNCKSRSTMCRPVWLINKNFNFNSKFGRHLYSLISKVFVLFFFPSTSCIFVFTIATIFSRDSRQQYPFVHSQVQFQAKYSLFDSQTDRGLTFRYAILIKSSSV